MGLTTWGLFSNQSKESDSQMPGRTEFVGLGLARSAWRYGCAISSVPSLLGPETHVPFSEYLVSNHLKYLPPASGVQRSDSSARHAELFAP